MLPVEERTKLRVREVAQLSAQPHRTLPRQDERLRAAARTQRGQSDSKVLGDRAADLQGSDRLVGKFPLQEVFDVGSFQRATPLGKLSDDANQLSWRGFQRLCEQCECVARDRQAALSAEKSEEFCSAVRPWWLDADDGSASEATDQFGGEGLKLPRQLGACHEDIAAVSEQFVDHGQQLSQCFRPAFEGLDVLANQHRYRSEAFLKHGELLIARGLGQLSGKLRSRDLQRRDLRGRELAERLCQQRGLPATCWADKVQQAAFASGGRFPQSAQGRACQSLLGNLNQRLSGSRRCGHGGGSLQRSSNPCVTWRAR